MTSAVCCLLTFRVDFVRLCKYRAKCYRFKSCRERDREQERGKGGEEGKNKRINNENVARTINEYTSAHECVLMLAYSV